VKHASLDAYAADKNAAAYVWEIHRNGVVCEKQFAERSFVLEMPLREIGPAPYVFVAKPLRDDLPHASIPIEPGMKPIWQHRVRMFASMTPGDALPDQDVLLFGREYPDGTEEILQINPDGRQFVRSSIREALHSKE